MGIKSLVLGCEGLELTKDERAFFCEHQPWGFILFARNIGTPAQVAELTAGLRSCVDHEVVPILIDQEGGRVRRMRPPEWPEYPPGSRFGELYNTDHNAGLRLAWLQSRLMACDLSRCGINVDCLPVLDVPVPGVHDVIGDRAYCDNPAIVSEIGREAANGLLDGGVLPVMKHIPGHGRAVVDSHHSLPVVDEDVETLKQFDFAPFKSLNDLPLAMTAHVVYTAVDAESPATASTKVINEIIRGWIGFDGLLMSDDLSMNALSGDFSQRAKSAFAAGCDIVLHCNGVAAEMQAIAAVSPELSGHSFQRAEEALAMLRAGTACDESALREEFEQLCRVETWSVS